MTVIYRVKSGQRLLPTHPLHFSRFFPLKERSHRKLNEERQALVLFLAKLHSRAFRTDVPRGFCQVKLRLTSLRDWVYDYRYALDYFFEVEELGFNIGEAAHEISVLIPKQLKVDAPTESLLTDVRYQLPPKPEAVDCISKVYVRQDRRDAIFLKLRQTRRMDLAEPVEYLLSAPEHNFIFKRAGKLQQRDTSVWPVPAVETWPSWLREELFGPGIDIESAYTQYLVQQLKEIYADRPVMLQRLYPNLIAQVQNKQEWRESICTNVLGLAPDAEAIDLVKKVCMSLANGSHISPAVLQNGRAFSITADAIVKQVDDVSVERLHHIGSELKRIAGEYALAKKVICAQQLRLNPSRVNQKRVFASYFEWERVARYLIWESIDRHGIMVHDGIDGVPAQYIERLPELMENIGVKVST
jgi:hypothetical protein